MDSACVVCGSSITAGAELYSNLWEESLKQHPCCSKRCASAFSADTHWIPFALPAALTGREVEDRVERARGRVHGGELPAGVIHELLVAGIEPKHARYVLRSVLADLDAPPVDPGHGARNDRALTWMTTAFSAVSALFTGWIFLAGTRRAWSPSMKSRADRERVEAAEVEVDLWERKFRLPSSRGATLSAPSA